MFCPNCGNDVPEGMRFCTFCGQSMDEAAAAVNAAVQEQIEKENKSVIFQGKVAVVFTAVSIVLAIIFLPLAAKDDGILHALIEAPLSGLLVGGFIPGLCHAPALFKKLSGFLFLPIVGWAIAFVTVLTVCGMGGFIYMLVDLFKYLKLRKEMRSDAEDEAYIEET